MVPVAALKRRFRVRSGPVGFVAGTAAGFSFGGDDAAGGIGKHEVRFRLEVHLRVLPGEQVLVAPVGGGRAAVEQAGFGQHDRAGAGRVQCGALFIFVS